ncbi:MAG: glycine/betaine ABC transporter, partial [Candidatus Thermoplasmatota archaeon]|nr:glycine/betaine ABC transporter [Candidatus Thermoplasmatota archaeon]
MKTHLSDKSKIILVIILLITSLYCGCTLKTNDEEDDTSSGSLFSYTITGIDPGSGIMKNTETALDKYQLKEAGWML